MNLDEIKNRYQGLSEELANPNLDPAKRRELQRKASQFSAVIETLEEISRLEKGIEELKVQADGDSELAELYAEEISEKQLALQDARKEYADLLYPADEMDDRSVFLEIRAGAGGQEAALFAADLFRMYSNYAIANNWTVSIVDFSTTDLGGYKEIVANIKGKKVYRYLKFESGVHRVQRVPSTETQGRVHTSTVTVAVMPEAEDIDVTINPEDLRIDVYRSGGKGGQSVNTTDSAVRITHIPTGVVVTCQDERSQVKNKAKAMKVLQSRILEADRARKAAERSAERKKQVGTGERSEKIRTYNFPQNRVTDHRIGLTLKKLDIIMEGPMDDLIQPMIEWDHDQKRQEGESILS